ncbi:hypothetical protein EDB83DRAFT_2364006 [Lactarius deliciosus]|nr:hypothetical protein EDB83DRAFT_2364006 [Lactarius deliciosus]
MLLLSHPDATAFTNMVFLTLGNLYSFTLGTVPSYVRDLVQQTSSILSQALPPELSAKMRLNLTNSLMYVSDGTPSLTAEMYRRVLHMWMKNLWHFTRDYNRRGNSVPLASYVSIAFTNPEMTRRILGERDPAVHMIGRCVEVLVVNKLATEIKSRNDSDKLACVSTILDTKSDDVMLLLSHPGAIEFTNMIFLALDDIDSSAPGTVPMDMLDVIQQTSSSLSKALPSEMSAKMRLNQAITLIDVSDGITAKMHLTVSRVWMKNLWDFTREYNERGNSPLPSYISVAFTNPEMTHRIRNQRDLAVRVVGRCVGALVVNKLAAYIKSRNVPVSNVELACLSAILSTERDDVLLLLRHPGAIELTNIVLFALANIDTSASTSVPSDALDVILQTFGILSRALPSELNTVMRLDQTGAFIGISNGTTSFTAEMYLTVLRVWMKDLWDFARGYNESGDSAPFPAYVRIAFTNPELTRCIREQRDIAVRVVGRCIGALVVIKLATDIKSRDIPVTDDELACLSAILGTRSDEVIRLLGHPGAIEFTNMVFLALDDFDSTFGTVPSYVLDVVQQTSSALSHDLPPELKPVMRLRQTNTLMNASDGTSSLTGNLYTNILRRWMKNLWHLTREYNERGNSVPLPTYVFIVFTNPEMTRRVYEQRDLALCVIGRCTEALVVAKLAADIESRDAPVSNDELGGLSAILRTESYDVGLCLSQPGTIQLVNLASLAVGVVSSLPQMPPDTRNVLQQTLTVLSQTIPVRANAELPLDQTITPVDISDNNFEHTILFHIHDLLMMFIPGASSFVEEVRTCCLRMCLKALWHCAKAYHQTSDPLSSYGPLVLAAPEVTRLFQTEQDLVARITGSCFGALIVDKLMNSLESALSSSGHFRNTEMACISTILGTEHREVLLLPHQLRVINLWNVVSLMSSEADTLSTAAGLSVDVLKLVQDTLDILVNRLRDHLFVSRRLPIDQWQLLQKRYSDVVNALASDQLRKETVKTLNQLRQLLEKLLPGVEESHNTAIPSPSTSH